jgi:hypothetical protein
MADMECPYCSAEQDVCHDDGAGYDEGRRHEHTCSSCDKTFVFSTFISFDYTPHKADCLNGAAHNLKLSTTYPREFSMMRCRDCDFERRATHEELEQPSLQKDPS